MDFDFGRETQKTINKIGAVIGLILGALVGFYTGGLGGVILGVIVGFFVGRMIADSLGGILSALQLGAAAVLLIAAFLGVVLAIGIAVSGLWGVGRPK